MRTMILGLGAAMLAACAPADPLEAELEAAIRLAAGPNSRPRLLHYNTTDGSKVCGAANTYGFAKIFYAERRPGGDMTVIVQPTIDHDPNPDRLAVRRNVGRQTIVIGAKCRAAHLPIGHQ